MMPRLATLLLPVVLFGIAGCGPSFSETKVAPSVEGISREAVDTLWRKAVKEFAGGHWSKAATLFERVALEVPAGDTLAIEAAFRLGECQLGDGNPLQAARQFRKVSDETPNSWLAPDALLRAGDAYAQLWRRPELDPTYGQTARATYQELLNRYPEAPAAARARVKIQDLEEEFALKDYKAALYYLRFKAYDSAILYLKGIAATYPRASVTPDALLRLIDAYRKLDYEEDIVEACGYIRRFHPTTPGVDQRCPAVVEAPAGP